MNTREARRRTFDTIAAQYDRFRPGYPAQLTDDVVSLSGVPARGRVLEIGCGTGKATIEFARQGLRMTCLEPGVNLAEIAKRNVATFPDVSFEIATFEDWPPPAEAFDLVIAAQSFHFVDPATGIEKAARVLTPTGAVAIFGNRTLGGESEAHRRVQEAYARHAPELTARNDAEALEDRIDASGEFGTVVMTRYRWRHVYAAEDYIGLMGTQSDHRLLPDASREALLAAIHAAITACGGAIAIDYVTKLHLARRRAAPASNRIDP